jgi:hypothetical protein
MDRKHMWRTKKIVFSGAPTAAWFGNCNCRYDCLQLLLWHSYMPLYLVPPSIAWQAFVGWRRFACFVGMFGLTKRQRMLCPIDDDDNLLGHDMVLQLA